MNTLEEILLREKENRIKTLLFQGESSFINAFSFLHKHYSLKNFAGKAPILPVFEAIYIENIDLPTWKLAIHCNISRSTLFNYRNTIINDFDLCLNENILTEEIAFTKGEKK